MGLKWFLSFPRAKTQEAVERNSMKLSLQPNISPTLYDYEMNIAVPHLKLGLHDKHAQDLRKRTLLTRHGSSGVAAASVDRHNCGEE